MKLVLASSSPYRKQLLERLQIEFETASPDINEDKLPDEPPRDYVKRLSIEKSKILKNLYPESLIIGSDQIILTATGEIQGKPLTHEQAVTQLKQVSGSEVDLITGLAVFNSKTENLQFDRVEYKIGYRQLTASQIENYLQAEQPYNCAGALKSEGLGTSLLRYLSGDDPTAIIGLPLISLVEMLAVEGLAIV